MHNKIREILNANPIVPVYTPQSVSETLAAAKNLLTDGINCIEITLRTECALEAIQAVKDSDIDIALGVGTVRDSEMVATLKEIGVDFAVSPGLTSKILSAAVQHNLPLLPGIATPSELLTGIEYGFETFKMFPANAIDSKALLKAFNATYPNVRFCPTGGVNSDNVSSFLNLENVIAVGGSWVFK